MKRRAMGALHAVIRPQYLRQAMQLHKAAHGPPIVRRSKALVPRRMPVLRGHDDVILTALNFAHSGCKDRIAIRYRECAPRQKVVLQVHQDECSTHGHLLGLGVVQISNR